MNNIANPLQQLKIDNYFKYILYLAGFILLLTLFLDIKYFDIYYLRKICFWAISFSLLIWILKDLVDNLNNILYERILHSGKDMGLYYELGSYLIVFFFIIQFIIWILYFLLFIL